MLQQSESEPDDRSLVYNKKKNNKSHNLDDQFLNLRDKLLPDIPSRNSSPESINITAQGIVESNFSEIQKENEGELLFSGDVSQLIFPTDLNTNKIDLLQETLNARIDTLEQNILLKLDNMSTNIDMKVENIHKILANISAKLDLIGSGVSQNEHDPYQPPTRLFDKIDSLEQAEEFEKNLSDDEFFNSVVTTIKAKHGTDDFRNCRTAALHLVDYFWTRQFFNISSWSGLGKTKDKIRFKNFLKTIDVFKECVSVCCPRDVEWTVCKNVKFLQDQINNSGSRLNRDQNQRTAASRSRMNTKKKLTNYKASTNRPEEEEEEDEKEIE